MHKPACTRKKTFYHHHHHHTTLPPPLYPLPPAAWRLGFMGILWDRHLASVVLLSSPIPRVFPIPPHRYYPLQCASCCLRDMVWFSGRTFATPSQLCIQAVLPPYGEGQRWAGVPPTIFSCRFCLVDIYRHLQAPWLPHTYYLPTTFYELPSPFLPGRKEVSPQHGRHTCRTTPSFAFNGMPFDVDIYVPFCICVAVHSQPPCFVPLFIHAFSVPRCWDWDLLCCSGDFLYYSPLFP